MASVKFRTADGRVVTFRTKKNPSDSPRYRAGSRTARAVDALDRARKVTKKRKVVKRSTAKRKTSEGCTTVKFRRGPVVAFCGPAGSDKPRKRRLGKKLYRANNLDSYSFVKGKALTDPSALKGKRNGQVFTRAGKTYRMISYKHPSSGKLVRYALRVKKSAK